MNECASDPVAHVIVGLCISALAFRIGQLVEKAKRQKDDQ